MRFPVTITHRTGKVKIYAPANNFTYYRLSFTVAGKRQMQTFATYSEAKAAGETKAKEIHNNSAAASLTPSQSRDALAALERLDGYFKAKGKRISLNTATADYLDALGKLNVPLSVAVSGYYTLLRWVACGVAAFTAFQAVEIKKTGWLWIFVIVAVVLNPIAPLHLKRETWAYVDVAAAVLILLSVAFIDIRKPRP